jgi:parallel beta-helix repeat protein
VVAANHHVRIHDNEISLSHEAGVQIFGRGVSVEHNRISDGFAAGIRADNAIDVIISQNEIYHNRTVAIVLKGSSGSVARKNNLYSNGSGIAFVYGRGEPQNAAIENSVFSQVGEAIIVAGAQPFLKDNVIRFNNMGGESVGPEAGLKEIESTPAPAAATDDQATEQTGGKKRDRQTNHSGRGQGKASQ